MIGKYAFKPETEEKIKKLLAMDNIDPNSIDSAEKLEDVLIDCMVFYEGGAADAHDCNPTGENYLLLQKELAFIAEIENRLNEEIDKM